jgi:hypothetical protein
VLEDLRADLPRPRRVRLCRLPLRHVTGNGAYVLLRVARPGALAR